MSRFARMPQIMAVLLAIPTTYAFGKYVGEARQFGRLEAEAPLVASRGTELPPPTSRPKPEETAKKPEAQAKPEETAKKPEAQAKPEETAKKLEAQAKPEEKKAAASSDEGDASEGKKKKKHKSESESDDSAREGTPGEKVARAETGTSSASSDEEGAPEGSSKKKRRGSKKSEDEASGDTGQLTLKATGTAEVYIDGRKVGVAPISKDVSTGTHKVRFDCLTADGKKKGDDRTVEVLSFSEVSVDFDCP